MAPRKHIIWLCHSMATMLNAGLPVSRMLTVAARQGPTSAMKRAINTTAARIEEGDSLAEAMRSTGHFPDLLLNMIEAGETTGRMDAILAELTQFYELQHRLWRTFYSQITWPAVQYIAAIAIMAGAQFILSMVGMPLGNPARTLTLGYGIPVMLVLVWKFLIAPLGGTRPVHVAMLYIPGMRAVSLGIALTRFSAVMHLMTEAGVPMMEALARAFRATNNGAFMAQSDRAVASVKSGNTLVESLSATDLFPFDYLTIVEVAEESGQLTERFRWLAREHADRTKLALNVVGRAASILVWLIVATVIIYFIFMIAMQYVGNIHDALEM